MCRSRPHDVALPAAQWSTESGSQVAARTTRHTGRYVLVGGAVRLPPEQARPRPPRRGPLARRASALRRGALHGGPRRLRRSRPRPRPRASAAAWPRRHRRVRTVVTEARRRNGARRWWSRPATAPTSACARGGRPGGHRRRCDPHPRNPSLGAGTRGRSAGRCGSHAGRSAEGARMRGDGRDPKLGRRSEVPAVGGSSAAHAASAGSAASKTRDAAERVAGCAIAASLAGAPPHRNGGRGRSRRGGRARLDCPAHPCPRDEHRTPKTACRRTSYGSS